MKTYKQLIEIFLGSANKKLDLPMIPTYDMEDIMEELGFFEEWCLDVNEYGDFYKSYTNDTYSLDFEGSLRQGKFKLTKVKKVIK